MKVRGCHAPAASSLGITPISIEEKAEWATRADLDVLEEE